jgi:hypothetical protein
MAEVLGPQAAEPHGAPGDPAGASGDLRIAIAAKHLQDITADQAKVDQLIAAATSFREFLNHWHFKNGETGEVQILGHGLWPSQELAVREMEATDKAFFLKARKLGETTLECAFDGWKARFGQANSRVHLWSRRDDAAQELLEAVEFGLERLPEWMQLPVARQTTHEYRMNAGEDDERIIKAYPANEETAVEATCTHGHIDEWARMKNPRKVFQAIEPSLAGTAHILTTGLGPTNYSSQFWRRCRSGEADFKPVFIDALKRPGRSVEWLEAKYRSGGRSSAMKQEYPMTEDDALMGEGDTFFDQHELDRAGEETLGATPAMPGRSYVKSWDIGRHQDAAVGIVIDVTEALMDVVHYEKIERMPYPILQRRIERMHEAYPGTTVIEANSAGEAVAENCDIPEDDLQLFTTSGKSKAIILDSLKVSFQKDLLRYDAMEWPQLDQELRGYRLPDDSIVQDSVMSLAIGHSFAGKARAQPKRKRGRARVFNV